MSKSIHRWANWRGSSWYHFNPGKRRRRLSNVSCYDQTLYKLIEIPGRSPWCREDFSHKLIVCPWLAFFMPVETGFYIHPIGLSLWGPSGLPPGCWSDSHELPHSGQGNGFSEKMDMQQREPVLLSSPSGMWMMLPLLGCWSMPFPRSGDLITDQGSIEFCVWL